MPTDTMESALDPVQVFGSSANTVRVLEALTDGPTTSRDLAERTGAARSTVGRILDRGESRGWIESEGSRYELALLGEIMIKEFREYLHTLEGIQHLGDAINYLPEPVHQLGYHHFRDATFRKATAENPAEPFDHATELLRRAGRHRLLAETVTPRHTEVCWDSWSQGQQKGKIVLAARFVDTLRKDPERSKPWEEWAQAGLIWVYEGLDITLQILDEVVLIWLGEEREDDVYFAGVLESGKPAVVSWAESLFEDYRTEAAQLTPEMLAGG